MDKKQPIIGQAPPAEPGKDDPIVLIAQIGYVNHVQHCAGSRKSRLEDLMQRRSAKKWDAKKKARMVRRLMTANSELEQCSLALADLQPRFEALKAQHTRVNNIPFVPPAAGSLDEHATPAASPEFPAADENPFGG